MISLDIVVPVPAALVFHAPRVDLDVANTSLDHSTGHEALSCKMSALCIVNSVEFPDAFRLRVYINTFRGLLPAWTSD